MALTLNPIQARILGSLVEKSLTTPDLYPLTMNALVNACNQKSSRDPVMTLSHDDVANELPWLMQHELVGQRNEPGSRVNKFLHKIETLLNGGTTQEVAAIAVLLLRGPQTSGEIKTRTDRLCSFESPEQVETVLNELSRRNEGGMVVRLPRQPGHKECRYKHLFYDEASTPIPTADAPPVPISPRPSTAMPTLEQRLKLIEERLARIEERFPNVD